MMTLSQPNSPSLFNPYEEYIPGMSDEEELRRIGRMISESEGVGEMDDLDQEALGDLGFRIEQ